MTDSFDFNFGSSDSKSGSDGGSSDFSFGDDKKTDSTKKDGDSDGFSFGGDSDSSSKSSGGDFNFSLDGESKDKKSSDKSSDGFSFGNESESDGFSFNDDSKKKGDKKGDKKAEIKPPQFLTRDSHIFEVHGKLLQYIFVFERFKANEKIRQKQIEEYFKSNEIDEMEEKMKKTKRKIESVLTGLSSTEQIVHELKEKTNNNITLIGNTRKVFSQSGARYGADSSKEGSLFFRNLLKDVSKKMREVEEKIQEVENTIHSKNSSLFNDSDPMKTLYTTFKKQQKSFIKITQQTASVHEKMNFIRRKIQERDGYEDYFKEEKPERKRNLLRVETLKSTLPGIRGNYKKKRALKRASNTQGFHFGSSGGGGFNFGSTSGGSSGDGKFNFSFGDTSSSSGSGFNFGGDSDKKSSESFGFDPDGGSRRSSGGGFNFGSVSGGGDSKFSFS